MDPKRLWNKRPSSIPFYKYHLKMSRWLNDTMFPEYLSFWGSISENSLGYVEFLPLQDTFVGSSQPPRQTSGLIRYTCLLSTKTACFYETQENWPRNLSSYFGTNRQRSQIYWVRPSFLFAYIVKVADIVYKFRHSWGILENEIRIRPKIAKRRCAAEHMGVAGLRTA